MEMKSIMKFAVVAAAMLASACTKHGPSMDLDGDTYLLSLCIGGYDAVIDHSARTAEIEVPEGFDLSAMEITSIEISEGASANMETGDILNMNYPHQLTVSNGDAVLDYNVTASFEVEVIEGAKFLYLGLAPAADMLNPEEKAAAQWMLETVPGAMYASFSDVAKGKVDLSECGLIWWHLHIDGGVDSMEKFESHAADAISALTRLRSFYRSGGSFLLTRYATYYAAKLNDDFGNLFPNNCWGGFEDSPETVTDAWFFKSSGHENHPIYRGLSAPEGAASDEVYTFGPGYKVTNSTAQWHIGGDWGGYPTLDFWRTATGAGDLGYGSDGAVVVWEWPGIRSGRILCIGSGCYDWYADGYDASSDLYHANIAGLTLNSIDYLTK